MMCLCCGTSSHRQENSIGNKVDDMCYLIVSLTFGHTRDALANAGEHEQTIGATDQSNIIVIQSQGVVLA
jgi:hypothetical protein